MVQQDFSDANGTSAKFNSPHGVAVNQSGELYVSDEMNYRIRHITPSGVVITYAGNGQAGATDGSNNSASFNQPRGIAVDTSNNVYVCDYANHSIRKIRGGN